MRDIEVCNLLCFLLLNIYKKEVIMNQDETAENCDSDTE